MPATKNPEDVRGMTEDCFWRGIVCRFPSWPWRLRFRFLCFVMLAIGLAGCSPSGSRALFKGKKYLDHGDYANAAVQLKTAATLLATNAQVWNYYGVALQHAGQADAAAGAYQNALRFDRDLVEAHYNLGCLWMEQQKYADAKTEFTAYTLRRSNQPEGWLKLGMAQLEANELTLAEKSFSTVLSINGNSAEALNGLGLARIARNRPEDAAKFFSAALEAHPDFAPARLNLAVVNDDYLNDDKAAAENYRAYLAMTPRPENWDVANKRLNELEPPPKVAAPTPPPPPPRPAPIVRTNPPAIVRATPDVAPGNSLALTNTVRTARNLNPPRSTVPRVTSNAPVVAAPKPAPRVVVPAPVFPRYGYASPSKPGAGDRKAAAAMFTQAHQFEQSQQWSDAEASYQTAAQLDPGWFEAQYNYGVLAYRERDYSHALAADEIALAIRPDSVDARFNFALALSRAGYPVDAVSELKKVLAANPNEVRAHLALGNLYALQLRDAAQARQHYERVIALDPRNPSTPDIQYWLSANPP